MIERNEYLDTLKRFKDKQLIKVVTGLRRCGKSTLLTQFKNFLLQNGINEKQIIWINLEDLQYNFITDYMSLYTYINDNLQPDKTNYIFIDEVQQIQHFQKAVDSLYIKNNTDIYITGSNANLLSSELATLLSGRYIEIKMLPLSFIEYKTAYPNLSNDELYQKYISFGSLPYVTNLDTEDDVRLYISSIYNDIIIKDIMTRKNITDESMLKSIAIFALDNIGNLMSSNNIANTMINSGRSINVRTVEKYLESFTESYFLYKASRYDIKGKQYLKTGEKYYTSDLGLRYFILGRKIGDYGHILENVVYLELLRRGYDVYIGKADNFEIDFVAINSSGRIYIQVTESLQNTATRERELRPLQKLKDNYEKLILTSDKMPLSNENGIIIQNVLEWMLKR
ncbi:MAG: ATP-binding protein [Spirochaetales bacterium]|nr:ATP-binding protein [Spirochaetales bacterium]